MFNQNQNSFTELRKTLSEHTTPVILWLGAGISKGAGFPLWLELRNELIIEAKKFLTESTIADSDSADCAKLQLAAKEDDLWLAFQHIFEVLGDTEFSANIVSRFDKRIDNVPEIYLSLMDLDVKGIVTTNIDKLLMAARSKSGNEKMKISPDFTGRECGEFCTVMSRSTSFILNLHGTLDKKGSWILTKGQLEGLMSLPAYSDFIKNMFYDKTVVFIGTNPTDQALSVHMKQVRRRDNNTTPLYWITDRKDDEAREFCDTYNVRRIIYSVENNHRELLDIIRLLKSTKQSKDDEIIKPVFNDIPAYEQRTRNIDLSRLTPEEKRKFLNKKAMRILEPNTQECYRTYQKFLKENGRDVNDAWYVEEGDELLGLKIEEEIGRGAFGIVYRAKEPDNNTVAVKILKHGEMQKSEYLQSFRRGVRAMEILSRSNLEGVVQYKFASEIPAMVVMDYIDGYSLADVVQSDGLSLIRDKLRVLNEISQIIRKAHALPERVLHRDIRPQNIMLEGFDYNSDDWHVRVLDFDLAFHRGANELSLRIDSGLNGYLAPEQIEARSEITRNSRVDSYGFAMVCYFVLSRCEPLPMQCKQNDWDATLKAKILSIRCDEWESLGYKLYEIIKTCTSYDQNRRMDLYQVSECLSNLSTAVRNADGVRDSELIEDEFVVLVANRFKCLKFVEVELSGRRKFHCINTCYEFDRNAHDVLVRIEWQNTGNMDFAQTAAKTRERAKALTGKIQKLGHRAEYHSVGAGVAVEVLVGFDALTHAQLVQLANLLSEYRIDNY